MTRRTKDEEREERIHNDLLVDAYGPEEQAIGWYNYLADILQFPFSAQCIVHRATSPEEPILMTPCTKSIALRSLKIGKDIMKGTLTYAR